MVDQPDTDDVDVFVSPRHFGGRTPGPKATLRKVFEEEQAKARAESDTSDKTEIEFEGVKYNYDSERGETGDFVHKTVGRNNVLRKIVLVANYLLALVGIGLIGVAVWVLLQHKNGGIFSFTSRQGLLLRSPIAFGVCFLIAAGGCIISGYIFGVRHVAPSLVEGLQLDQRRRSFLCYQALSAGSVVVLALILFSSLPPLHKTKRTGITTTLWQDMSVSHPDRICRFEIQNSCAGAKDQSCSGSKRAHGDKSCPGHFCIDNCQAISPRPQTNKPLCAACFSAFSDATRLSDCKSSEREKKSSSACISLLRSDVQRFLTVIVASSSVAIGVLLVATVLGTISPILNART